MCQIGIKAQGIMGTWKNEQKGNNETYKSSAEPRSYIFVILYCEAATEADLSVTHSLRLTQRKTENNKCMNTQESRGKSGSSHRAG